MLFLVAFGVPEKSVFTRLFCVFATAMLANFQDLNNKLNVTIILYHKIIEMSMIIKKF